MATAIEKIRQRNAAAKQNPASEPTPTAAQAITTATNPAETRRETPPALAEHSTDPKLPPAIPCLICECPFVWSTVYEPGAFRCCDCEPPPGGWHAKTGGRQFVAKLLALVELPSQQLPELAGRLSWEDWTIDIRPEPEERPRTLPRPFAGSGVRPVGRAEMRERARSAATDMADEIAF